MSVQRITATTKEQFDAALAAHAGKEAKLLVLFTGASDSSGVSWCPDCNDAKPVIEDALSKADGPVTYISVPLDRSEYKGNASHWARLVGRRRLWAVHLPVTTSSLTLRLNFFQLIRELLCCDPAASTRKSSSSAFPPCTGGRPMARDPPTP